jgi:hypothetical protein
MLKLRLQIQIQIFPRLSDNIVLWEVLVWFKIFNHSNSSWFEKKVTAHDLQAKFNSGENNGREVIPQRNTSDLQVLH